MTQYITHDETPDITAKRKAGWKTGRELLKEGYVAGGRGERPPDIELAVLIECVSRHFEEVSSNIERLFREGGDDAYKLNEPHIGGAIVEFLWQHHSTDGRVPTTEGPDIVVHPDTVAALERDRCLEYKGVQKRDKPVRKRFAAEELKANKPSLSSCHLV